MEIPTQVKKSYKEYISSFKGLYNNPRSLFFDIGGLGLMVAVFLLFQAILSYLNVTFISDLSSAALNGIDTSSLDSVTTNLNRFFVLVIPSIIIFICLEIYLYCKSRSMIYKELQHASRIPKLRQWVGLSLLSAVLLGLLFIPFLIGQIALVLIVKSFIFNPTTLLIINGFYKLIGIFVWLYIYYSIKYHFSLSHKVWHSIGEGLTHMKKMYKQISVIFIYQLVTLMFVNTIMVWVLSKFFSYSLPVQFITQFILFILFLSWSRYYFYQVVCKIDHHKIH